MGRKYIVEEVDEEEEVPILGALIGIAFIIFFIGCVLKWWN